VTSLFEIKGAVFSKTTASKFFHNLGENTCSLQLINTCSGLRRKHLFIIAKRHIFIVMKSRNDVVIEVTFWKMCLFISHFSFFSNYSATVYAKTYYCCRFKIAV